ncbi:malate dehydrogenase [candidate division WOR-3 bacterium]|uniref:Malate dehydrogenase n=1 Tax=candidate division WOR-3 bacterium TaxID=2052148 RepID=A0A9D5QBX4_UNCW3|nr:malate dehydrogenase [candidate division WOR-3 bacterium]MBD3364063.1 malate dehydrogenase [candidate division WOR-3 bacterium]
MVKKDVDELLAKAQKPGKDAMIMHPHYKGKVQVMAKCAVRTLNDFAIWYTPGVAKPCRDINENPEKVYEHTNKGNMVAVVSDGTRVLGLGDIGPEAGLPVMEGKGLLFKYLGGVDAFPICLDTKDPDKIIETVMLLQPSFGGVNLEDISQPKCFYVLDELRKKAHIPIWHDDQQGTAAIIYAGLINAVKLVGKKIEDVRLVFIGAGAANIRAAHVCISGGFDPGNMILVDSKGALHKGRTELAEKYKEKWELAQITNKDNITGGPEEAMKGADAMVGASTPGPGTIKPEWIKGMGSDPIVFPCANPVPEIWPWEAKEAGAAVVATGRSDFPNQVNNSLGFPGIFRGTLDVRASTITDGMCIAAAKELAKVAEDKGLKPDYIIPSMDEWEVFPREAAAVAMQAISDGVAGITDVTYEDEMNKAEKIIKNARESVQLLMKEGQIPPAPEGV